MASGEKCTQVLPAIVAKPVAAGVAGTCGPFIIRVTDASTPGQYVERKFQIPII